MKDKKLQSIVDEYIQKRAFEDMRERAFSSAPASITSPIPPSTVFAPSTVFVGDNLSAGQKLTAKDFQNAINNWLTNITISPRGALKSSIFSPITVPARSFFSISPAAPTVEPPPSSYFCPHASLWKRR